MKALRFHQFGTPPSVLAIEDLPTPQPKEGEVLVQLKAAGINPSDFKNVAGFFPATKLPRTPGRDFAGIVVEGIRYKGEAVWGSVPAGGIVREGVHAEFAIVPVGAMALKPQAITFEQAAAIGVPYITAWSCMDTAAQVKAGETVLIVGAAGAVGQAAAQIACWKGARVIGAVRSDKPALSAFATINTQTCTDLPEQVRQLTGGKGVEVVLDCVGGVFFEPALCSLARSGRHIVITSQPKEKRVNFNLVDFYHNDTRIIGVDSMHLTATDVGNIASELARGFDCGALCTPPLEVTPFAGAITAYDEFARGVRKTKQILQFA